MMRRLSIAFLTGAAVALLTSAVLPSRAAEAIKIGMVKVTTDGPIYIAQDKGYFAAEGLSVDFAPFDAAQIVTQATQAGDVDIGATAVSAALYNLAAKGGLTLIGGLGREVPGFHGTGFLATNRAWDAGLHSFGDLEHKTIAVPQIGGPLHYDVALIAEKYGLDIETMRIMPLQTLPNVASAIIGGQPDVGLTTSTSILKIVAARQARLLGWVGDETPWQVSAIFVATKTANERRPMLDAFLRAYKRGAHDYYAAFTGSDGKRKDGLSAGATIAILAKYLEQPAPQVAQAIGFVDPEARLDVKDVLHQVEWFKAQRMVPAEANGAAMIDQRYVVPLQGG
jgi:NitT/TauT family transport system substrate-binding protein